MVRLAFCFLSLLSSLAIGQINDREDRVISSDQRIVVFGTDTIVRGEVLSQITSLREELNFILGSNKKQKSQALYPLRNDFIVTLFGKPGDVEKKRSFAIFIREVEGIDRYRIELNIHLARGLNRTLLRKYALECLLLDQGLSTKSADLAADQKVAIDPWIVSGLLERMAWRKKEGDRGLYKTLFKNDMMLEIEEMLSLKNIQDQDAARRTIFRVSAGAFVMTMLNQANGKQSFHNFLAQLATFEGEPLFLLQQHFPTIGLSKQSLAKWWALQLQNLTQDFVTETLTILETEKALTDILQADLEIEEGSIQTYRIVAFQDILELETEIRRLLLIPMLEKIQLLSFRCFPSYQPLLSEYARIIRQLAQGNDKDLTARLKVLEDERRLFREIGIRTRDYLDWFQITNATQLTGEFHDYQKLKKSLETEITEELGPLDQYLNSVQKLYDQ